MPVVADWNGDGRSKIGIFRNGTWIIDHPGTGVYEGPPTDRVDALGQAGDTPITGAWQIF